MQIVLESTLPVAEVREELRPASDMLRVTLRRMVTAVEEAYHRLCAYTLAHGDATFIHQHVVDAYAAQHADEATKPIPLTFALVGLYLHVERGCSGRDVQRVHMLLARRRQAWPTFPLPRERGRMTVIDVMNAPEDTRDKAIDDWCVAVWEAFRDTREEVVALLQRNGVGSE